MEKEAEVVEKDVEKSVKYTTFVALYAVALGGSFVEYGLLLMTFF